MVFHGYWLVSMVFQGSFMAFHGFWLVSMVFPGSFIVLHGFWLVPMVFHVFWLVSRMADLGSLSSGAKMAMKIP